MRKCLLATVLLITWTAHGSAGLIIGEGTVIEVTPDTITIQQGDVKTMTVTVCKELLTNTDPNGYVGGPNPGSAKFTEVKKGNRVQFEGGQVNGKWICLSISLRGPSDAGVVTEVGPDTITLRDDKGTTTTYKVEKELVDNRRPATSYSPMYPNRFSEVTPGCRIVVNCHKRYGMPTIMEIEVTKEKGKEP